MLTAETAVEVLHFLDMGSRECAQLICRLFENAFRRYFKSSPPIRGICVAIWFMPPTVRFTMQFDAEARIPNYFHAHYLRTIRSGRIDGRPEKCYRFTLQPELFSNCLLGDNSQVGTPTPSPGSTVSNTLGHRGRKGGKISERQPHIGEFTESSE